MMLPVPVQEGFWVNYSRGRTLGSTLTLADERANLLIAFVALFVGVVGTRVWILLAFAVHQYREGNGPKKRVDRKTQAILVNSKRSSFDRYRAATIVLGAKEPASGSVISTVADMLDRYPDSFCIFRRWRLLGLGDCAEW